MNTPRREATSFAAATLHYMLGFMPIYFAPIIIMTLGTSGATALNAAKIGSGAVILSTVATLVAPAFFNRFRSSAMARLSAVIALSMSGILGLGLVTGAVAVAAILILSTASGVLLAAAIKQEAQHKNADRRLGYLTALGTSLIALLLFGLGWLGVDGNAPLFFGIWAVLLMLAVIYTLSDDQDFSADQRLQDATANTSPKLTNSKSILFLFGVGMIFALTGGIYTFAGSYLNFIGVDSDFLMTVLGLCVAAEVFGALCASQALRFLSPKVATAFGVAAICIGTVAALYTSSEVAFAVALAVYGIGFFWAMVSVLVWAQEIDTSGSLATVTQGIINLVFAGGTIPFLALMEVKGLEMVTLVQVTLSVIGLLLLLVLSRIFSQRLTAR